VDCPGCEEVIGLRHAKFALCSAGPGPRTDRTGVLHGRTGPGSRTDRTRFLDGPDRGPGRTGPGRTGSLMDRTQTGPGGPRRIGPCPKLHIIIEVRGEPHPQKLFFFFSNPPLPCEKELGFYPAAKRSNRKAHIHSPPSPNNVGDVGGSGLGARVGS